MVEVLIIYHTYGDGPVGRLAEGIRAGAEQVEGAVVTVKPVSEVSDADLVRAGGIAIGSPKMPGHTVSPEIGALIGRMSEIREHLNYKVGAAFSGSHGSFGGQESVIGVILRSFLLYNMAVIGQGAPEAGGSDFVGGVIVEELDGETAARAARLGRRLAEMSVLVAGGRSA